MQSRSPKTREAVAPLSSRLSANQTTNFSISIRRSQAISWGIEINSLEEEKLGRIVVLRVQEESVMSAWNKNHPERQLLAGDQILEVNGKVGATEILQECKTAMVLHINVRPLLAEEDLGPWLAAARDFELNSDFDISGKLENQSLSLGKLLEVMKSESAGKSTIQAIGDKIILSQLLENMRVPQMPLLFSTRHKAHLPQLQQLETSIVEADQRGEEGAYDIVVKPTHLSNSSGALIFSKEWWKRDCCNAQKLVEHMEKHMAERASDKESEALKSVIPGFVVQARYKSCVEFVAPLEIRVVTLWGKARLGIWWWGRDATGTTPSPSKKYHRNTWLVRKNDAAAFDNSEESWEVLHEHKGENKGFEVALKVFLQAMPAMAAAAESIAKALGAPFLRSDFFVGSEKWGVRLNEVAYGSGVECRRKVSGSDGVGDDFPFIARILQEGFKQCQQRRPANHFMGLLGAEGATYNSMIVKKLGVSSEDTFGRARPRLPSAALEAFDSATSRGAMVSHVSAGECDTPTAADLRSSLHKQVLHPVVAKPITPQAQGMNPMFGFPHKLNGCNFGPHPMNGSPVLLGRSVCCSVALMPSPLRRQA